MKKNGKKKIKYKIEGGLKVFMFVVSHWLIVHQNDSLGEEAGFVAGDFGVQSSEK